MNAPCTLYQHQVHPPKWFFPVEGVNMKAYRFFAVVIGLPFSEKKIIPRNTEQTEIRFISSEFRLFRGTENTQNFVPNHSTEDENFRIAFRGEKHSECPSEIRTTKRLKKLCIFVVTYGGFSVKPNFFAEFGSVLDLGMCYSEKHGIPQKEHFFHNVLSLFHEIFSERNFDGNPNS